MLEQLQEYLSGQNPHYLMAGAAAVAGTAGLVLGVIAGRSKSRRELRLSEINLEIAREHRLAAEQDNVLNLREMEYAENQKSHERQLELRKLDETRSQQNLAYKTAQVREIADRLGPRLTELVEAVKSYSAPNSAQSDERNQYRQKLIQEIEDALRENYTPDCNDFAIRGDDIERVNDWVEAKFPANHQYQVPEEIKKLVSLIEEFK